MTTPLRALIIEDSKDDTLLLVRELESAGYEPRLKRVGTPEAMAAALDEQSWDLVIADYRMPSLSSTAALRLLQEKALDLPFIIVSKTIGVERAVEAMTIGAHDVVLKSNLKRLLPAIQRELQKALVRRERVTTEVRLNRLALYDLLTELPNRQFFMEQLSKALLRAQQAKQSVALLFLDLDRLKMCNDLLGHLAGDELLKAVAMRLKSLVRESDTVARLGGDEFTVILEDVISVDSVARFGQKLLHAFTQGFKVAGRDFFITCSIGVALYPIDATDMTTLLKSADAAMYAAKEYRGTIRFSSPSINARTMEQLTLETGLRRALDHNEFVLHYQPVVEFGTRKIVSVEALLHWQHPERGLLTPGAFIPLVEGSDLIVPIGEWVLRTSCEQLRTWQAKGFYELRMTVNVAPRQLIQQAFIRKLVRILRETGIKPACVELELTERILMRGMERVVPQLQALRNLGIQIDIDDFGAEYSSLNYLRQLPVTGLKIDRSFVRGITTNPEDASIAAMIIDLAHSLRLKVIAEGVETLRQAAVLQNKGCAEMQGHYFSPPLPARTLTTLLTTGNGIIAARV